MKALQYLNKYFFKYKWRLISGVLITIVSKIFSLQVPSIVGSSLNMVEQYLKGIVVDVNQVKADLFKNILLILGATILAGMLTFLMRQTIIVMSRLIEFDLKNEVYSQYQRLSLNFYKQNRTGDLMNRISEDVTKVRMYFGPAIMYTVNMVVVFIIGFSQMIKIDLKLTLYTLMPFPILSLSIFILSKQINKRSTVVQQYLSKLTTYSQEVFSGINVVKSYGIERSVIKNFDELSEASKEKNISLYKVQALFFPLMILLIGLSNILVLYIGGNRYISGEIQIGVIAEFILYVNILTWPVAVVGWVTSMVQQAEASQQRINEFLKEVPEIKNLTAKKTKIKGKIKFKNVSLIYEDTNIKALDNLSFSIEKGKTLAILGKTGSGKSTIVNLLARLYDATKGSILIDNKPIEEYNLYSLRERIGFVSQEPFLFSDTIANNIRFGKEDATEQEIIEAAKNAAIHKNIISFKNGYETILGERGVTLSGGQKQRIAIARAIIKKPTIFVFDDCLSAVDTETEEEILLNLNEISSKKTTFIVSHRVSSVKNADKIIVLNEGKIIQQGTHNQLLREKGYYKFLYDKQLYE